MREKKSREGVTFPSSRERKRESDRGSGGGAAKREFVLMRNRAECSISWEQEKEREGWRDGGGGELEG